MNPYGGMPEEPWLRRDTESDQAFKHFERYKNLGAQRSLAKAAELGAISQTRIEFLSSKHDWRRRVVAWDRYMARESNQRLLAAMLERMANQAMNIQSRVATRIPRRSQKRRAQAELLRLTFG